MQIPLEALANDWQHYMLRNAFEDAFHLQLVSEMSQ